MGKSNGAARRVIPGHTPRLHTPPPPVPPAPARPDVSRTFETKSPFRVVWFGKKEAVQCAEFATGGRDAREIKFLALKAHPSRYDWPEITFKEYFITNDTEIFSLLHTSSIT